MAVIQGPKKTATTNAVSEAICTGHADSVLCSVFQLHIYCNCVTLFALHVVAPLVTYSKLQPRKYESLASAL